MNFTKEILNAIIICSAMTVYPIHAMQNSPTSVNDTLKDSEWLMNALATKEKEFAATDDFYEQKKIITDTQTFCTDLLANGVSHSLLLDAEKNIHLRPFNQIKPTFWYSIDIPQLIFEFQQQSETRTTMLEILEDSLKTSEAKKRKYALMDNLDETVHLKNSTENLFDTGKGVQINARADALLDPEENPLVKKMRQSFSSHEQLIEGSSLNTETNTSQKISPQDMLRLTIPCETTSPFDFSHTSSEEINQAYTNLTHLDSSLDSGLKITNNQNQNIIHQTAMNKYDGHKTLAWLFSDQCPSPEAYTCLVNSDDANGDTPLMLCARYGSAASVALLIGAGANTTAINPRNGFTALDYAVLNTTEASAIIDQFVKNNISTLLKCAKDKLSPATRALLCATVNQNQAGPLVPGTALKIHTNAARHILALICQDELSKNKSFAASILSLPDDQAINYLFSNTSTQSNQMYGDFLIQCALIDQDIKKGTRVVDQKQIDAMPNILYRTEEAPSSSLLDLW